MTTATLTDYRAHLTQRLTERGVPEHLHRGLLAYLTERKQVGAFLTAVLTNNLTSAVLKADDESYPALREIVGFLVWCTPIGSWGSPEKVQAWLTESGPVATVFE